MVPLPAVEKAVDGHETSLSLLNILTVHPTLLPVLFRGHCYNVILNLKSRPQRIREFDNFQCHLRGLLGEFRNEPQAKTGKNAGFIFNHMEVLSFHWHLTFVVVPSDVPALPDVQVLHFAHINL